MAAWSIHDIPPAGRSQLPILNVLSFPGPSGLPPLVIAHGLFGSARNWTAVARRLAGSRTVLSCDMRNHGDSFHDADHSYAAMAGDLAAVIRGQAGPVHLLGHSMGGKAAMVMALREPGLLCSLIVADIAPFAYSHSHADTVAAMQRVDLARVTRRSDADAQLAQAIADPFQRAFLLQSLAIGADGARWKFNLGALAAHMGGITGFPAEDGRFTGPALFLRGSESDYVGPAQQAAIRARFPGAEIRTLQGAGHWLHADQPQEFCEEVSAWMASRDF
jgi:esterase